MEWSNPLAEAQWALPQRNGICSIFAVMGLDERNGSPNKLQLPKRRRNERGKILQLQDPPLLIFQAAQATLVIFAPCGSKESRLHQLLPKKHGRELTGSPQADPTATSFSIPWTDNDQTTDCQLQSPLSNYKEGYSPCMTRTSTNPPPSVHEPNRPAPAPATPPIYGCGSPTSALSSLPSSSHSTPAWSPQVGDWHMTMC